MADNDDFDYEDDDTPAPKQSGGGLRAKLEQALAKVNELTEQNASLASDLRKRSVSDILASKGLNPKVAALIPSSVGADQESINNWLTEYGDVLGVAAPPADSGESQGQGDVIDPAVVAAHQRAADATAGAYEMDRINSLEQQMANAKTPEEVDAIMAQARSMMPQ